MICLKNTSGGVCPHTLHRVDGDRRHWRCGVGHEWWGTESGALRSQPWPSDQLVGEQGPELWRPDREPLTSRELALLVLLLVGSTAVSLLVGWLLVGAARRALGL